MLNSLWLMLLRWVEPGIKVWHSFVLLTRKLNRVWIQSCNSPPKGLEFRLGDGFAALKVEDHVGVACLAGLPAGRPSRFSYSDHLKQVPSDFFWGGVERFAICAICSMFAIVCISFLSILITVDFKTRGWQSPRSFAAACELDPSKCHTLGAAAYVPHCSRGSTPERCTSWTLQSPLGLPKMGDPEIIQRCHFQQGNRWFWGIDKIIDILGNTQFVQTDSMCRVPHTWKLNSMK